MHLHPTIEEGAMEENGVTDVFLGLGLTNEFKQGELVTKRWFSGENRWNTSDTKFSKAVIGI